MIKEIHEKSNGDYVNIDSDVLKNIKINDILEVSETENTLSIFILIIDVARVLQIKEDSSTNERKYYVHFLNFEKRMDKWISEKTIMKNLGNRDKEKDGVKIF
jgi:hypothetical protein